MEQSWSSLAAAEAWNVLALGVGAGGHLVDEEAIICSSDCSAVRT